VQKEGPWSRRKKKERKTQTKKKKQRARHEKGEEGVTFVMVGLIVGVVIDTLAFCKEGYGLQTTCPEELGDLRGISTLSGERKKTNVEQEGTGCRARWGGKKAAKGGNCSEKIRQRKGRNCERKG